MAAGLRCWSSMHFCAKKAALFISNMMMWKMSDGNSYVAPRSPPVKLNVDPKSLHALVDGRGLWRATLTPLNSYCKHTSNTTHNH